MPPAMTTMATSSRLIGREEKIMALFGQNRRLAQGKAAGFPGRRFVLSLAVRFS
jgi:hypothetical protein